MGLLSDIVGSFTGSTGRDAAKAQIKAGEKGQEFVRENIQQARTDAQSLFGQGQEARQQGFQGALDLFSQSLPAQAQAFNQGNVVARQSLLAGLPQFQNAILGGQVDFGALTPRNFQNPDLSFFSQQLPQLSVQDQTFGQQVEPDFSGQLGVNLGGQGEAVVSNPLGGQSFPGFRSDATIEEINRAIAFGLDVPQALIDQVSARQQVPGGNLRDQQIGQLLGGESFN